MFAIVAHVYGVDGDAPVTVWQLERRLGMPASSIQRDLQLARLNVYRWNVLRRQGRSIGAAAGEVLGRLGPGVFGSLGWTRTGSGAWEPAADSAYQMPPWLPEVILIRPDLR